METIKIGNWLIDDKGIVWKGKPSVDYRIPLKRLNECGHLERKKMYDWLVHLPTKKWLTETDIYALNTALVYALERFGVGFSKDLSFVETLTEQQKIISIDANQR